MCLVPGMFIAGDVYVKVEGKEIEERLSLTHMCQIKKRKPHRLQASWLKDGMLIYARSS